MDIRKRSPMVVHMREIRGPVMEMDGVIHGLHTALVPDMMGE